MNKQKEIKGLVRINPPSKELLRQSLEDFEKNFKPLMEECEEWRRKSRRRGNV